MPEKSFLKQTRSLGRSRCTVPAFGFGAAHLGELYAKLSDVEARGTVEAAWAGGVRYFDTAPWYGHGLSEHRLGEVLRSKPRDSFKLSTKVGRVYARPADMAQYSTAPWAGGLPFEPRFDYSYDGVMRSHEDSLQRLAVTHVDVLIIHDLDRGYHQSDDVFDRHWRDLNTGGLKALHELKNAGDIQAIGAGVNTPDMIAPMAGDLDLDFLLVAMPYTLLDQAALHDGFPICQANDVSVVIGAPFASGLLATGIVDDAKYNYGAADADVLDKVGAISEICERFDVALPAAALQFVLAHPLVASVIPGAVSAAQIESNLNHLAATIPVEYWRALRDGGLIEADAPTPNG